MVLMGKEMDSFMKKLYDINQIIKNIYKNEPNFKPKYILTNNYATYIDKECIPEYILYHISKPLIDNFYFKVVVDSGEVFNALKDKTIKESISEIIIENDYIEFKVNSATLMKFNKDKFYIKNFSCSRQNYRKNISFICDSCCNIDNDEIDFILNKENKSLIHYVYDFDNENLIQYDNYEYDEDSSYLELFINKKFILGASYKEKKLKSGNKIEVTPIKMKITSNKNNSYYDINYQVKLKNDDIIEHHFMVIDF